MRSEVIFCINNPSTSSVEMLSEVTSRTILNYQTNITDSQRAVIVENCKEIFTTKSKVDVISVLNAIFYLVKTGCQWRMLPSNFPRWRTVYDFFRKWTSIGLLENLLDKLVELESADMADPGVAVIDRQSVKSAHPSSPKGIDGGKKIKGLRNAASKKGLKLKN